MWLLRRRRLRFKRLLIVAFSIGIWQWILVRQVEETFDALQINKPKANRVVPLVPTPTVANKTPSTLSPHYFEGVARFIEPSNATLRTQLLPSNQPKFLVVTPLAGQGAGNHMHGLLAAHLLGFEFDRIVCVDHDYTDFQLAFAPVDPLAVQHCRKLLTHPTSHVDPTKKMKPPSTWLRLLNYGHAPNECALKEKMASSEQVLHLEINTYPRWPIVPKRNWFFRFYKAKPALLQMLPYPANQAPGTVVHLRKGDTKYDQRNGWEGKSLRALGQFLVPGNKTIESDKRPFLVTNDVTAYDMLEQKFGWAHPNWESVTHSATRIRWGNRTVSNPTKKTEYQRDHLYSKREVQWLQMWADWYTLLTAQRVYHTASDFSSSAVHWNSIRSQIYQGLNRNGTNTSTPGVLLVEEDWVQREMPRLIDRTEAQLLHCDKPLLVRQLPSVSVRTGGMTQ